MENKILRFCIEKGLLLDRDVLESLSDLSEDVAREIITKISRTPQKIINRSFFSENVGGLGIEEKYLEKICINLGLQIEILREIKKTGIKEEPEKKNYGNVRVLYTSSNSTKKLGVIDFVKYFKARYNELRKILQERPELNNLVSINKISGRENFSIVGLVLKKRVTKNKNIILELEDTSGKINVLVNQNKTEAYEKAKEVVVDSVIGVRGAGNQEIFFVNDIIFPEIMLPEKSIFEKDESIAFTSDIHLGSKMFLESNFLKFIEWINGNLGDEEQREEALKVKYLFITGDSIDGVGIFPGQENWINILDIKEQYNVLARILKRIRKDVRIILCPGQHDAVRVAEPQPALDREFASALHDINNLILVSNPALVEIENNGKKGLKVLMYHGASMHSVIGEVESLRTSKAHETPSKVVRHLLRMRHLAPIHSAVTYIPNEFSDDLVIKEVPDIVATGDLHRPEVDVYNNVLIICSSCWQSITPFEEKVGNRPDPCKVPIFNMKTRQIKILDFSDENSDGKRCEEKDDKIVCEVSSGGGK